MKSVMKGKRPKTVWRPVSTQVNAPDECPKDADVELEQQNNLNDGGSVEARVVNELIVSSSVLEENVGSYIIGGGAVRSKEKHTIKVESLKAYLWRVTTASEKLQSLVKEAIKSPTLDYAHFVSLPLAIHSELVEKLFKFQNSVLGVDSLDDGSNEDTSDEEDRETQLDGAPIIAVKLKAEEDNRNIKVDISNIPIVSYPPKASKSSNLDERIAALYELGIDKSIFIKPKTFHLTVLILKLYNKDLVDTAAKVFQSLSPKVINALDGQPVIIRLKGLVLYQVAFVGIHEEMDASEVCVTCTQNCTLLHGKKKDASSVDKSFVKLLFGCKTHVLPPKVSQTIPVLGDGQPHVLEDSNGQRWPVTLGNRNGALAFEKGWERFYADHGLKEGYILHFSFLQSHFLVKIYDTTCTPKLNFSKANDNKSETSNNNESAKELGAQKISEEFSTKQVSTTSIASGSECKTQGQPSGSSVISVAANRMHSQLMNFDKPPSSRNGDGTGSSVISRAVKLGAHSRMHSQPRRCLPPLVVNPDNLPSPENEDRSQLMIKDKPSGSSVISGSDNRILSQPMTMYKPPSSEDGDGGRKLPSTTLVKFRGENGKENQVSGKDNEVCNVVKTEPVESFDRACLGTSGDTFKAVVESTEWLELQKSLPSISFHKRADQRVVGLRGPDNRVWPVLYVEKGGLKAMVSGWKFFYYSNGLKEGDECTFIPEEMPNVPIFNNDAFYKVNIVRK